MCSLRSFKLYSCTVDTGYGVETDDTVSGFAIRAGGVTGIESFCEWDGAACNQRDFLEPI